jgi:hypothetical protein
MKRFRLFGLMFAVVLVVGVMTAGSASAFELPDIHTALPGETYPIVLSGEAKAAAESETEIRLENEVNSLPAATVSVLLIASELTSLGSIGITFTKVHENNHPTVTCSTEGDGAGVALVPSAEFHAVDLNNTGVPATLKLGFLVLFPAFTVTCTGGLKVKTEAPNLGAIDIPTPGVEGDIEGVTALTHCIAGKPGIAEQSSFVNDAGEQGKETALLKANFGTGNSSACEEIPALPLTLEPAFSLAKMFTILF